MRDELKSVDVVPVSIPAPGPGCARTIPNGGLCHQCFNSRTPGGVRQRRSIERLSASDCFNSRTPGGVRLQSHNRAYQADEFQFTHPGRGAT